MQSRAPKEKEDFRKQLELGLQYQQMNSQKETLMCYWGQISILATAAREPVYISAVILSSLAYDAPDAMDYDNLETALSTQIQFSQALIFTVRKESVEPIVLAKWWSITPERVQMTIQTTTQERDKDYASS